jgi:riboflavin kinase/FMN adenylyltransferase
MIVETVADIPVAPTACSVAIGTFDGVHRGHRQLLEMMVADAHANGRAAVVLTFDPHPLTVLRPELAPRLLMTPEQRYRNCRAGGRSAGGGPLHTGLRGGAGEPVRPP